MTRASPAASPTTPCPATTVVVAWLATYQVLLLIAIGTVARSGRRALLLPGTGGVLLPLGMAWRDGWLPGFPTAPDGLRIWMLAAPAIAIAAIGLLLPRTGSDDDQQPLGTYTDVAWGGRGPAVIAASAG